MCLLFFQSKNDPEEDEYKLILVNVRDEFYTRPAQPARFWPEYPSIIGGQDTAKGRSGGTWLAMNKDNGRIGVLLNILQPQNQIVSNKLGRGFIVNDYLTGSLDHQDFLLDLSRRRSDYNGFQTIALQVASNGVSGSYYSNFVTKCPEMESQGINSPLILEEGIHCFGNSLNPFDPWPKVTYGRKRFEALMSKHRTTDTEEDLTNDLFEMMMDRTLLPVDQNMLIQGTGSPYNLRRLSSLCVEMPDVLYGSRYDFSYFISFFFFVISF